MLPFVDNDACYYEGMHVPKLHKSIYNYLSTLKLLDGRGERGLPTRAAIRHALTSTAGVYSVRVLRPRSTDTWID
jgi:hypothetical protein